MKNDPTYEPGSQMGVEGGQREGVGECQGAKGVMFASPGQSQHHGETSAVASAGGHCFPLPTHHQAPLCSQYGFLRQVLWCWKATGALGCLEAPLQTSYSDIQRDIQEGLVGINNCLAAQARDWKENQNAE